MSDDTEAPDQRQPTLTPDELDQLPPDLRIRVERSVEMIQSPLLPPAILAQYDETVPGLAQKLVEWTEAETAHRHKLEMESFSEVRTLRSRAQLSGAAVSITGLVIAGVVGVYSAENGSFAGALVASAVAIASVGGPLAARILAGRWGGEGTDPNNE